MATGDAADVEARLRGLVPASWFPSDAPFYDGVLAGLASTWASLLDRVAFANEQTRIATMTGRFLDLAAADFFGTDLLRKPGEGDLSFQSRLTANLLLPRATRAAVSAMLTVSTGRAPIIVEPWRTADAGAWDTPGSGWDAAGRWGDLNLPWQMLVIAFRPDVSFSNVNGVSGFDCGFGGWDRTAFALVDPTTARIGPTDAEIYSSVAAMMPAGTTAWVQIHA